MEFSGPSSNSLLALTPRNSENGRNSLVSNPILNQKDESPHEIKTIDNGYKSVVDEYTSSSLLDELNSDTSVMLFLRIMGLLWPNSNDLYFFSFLQIVWSSCIRIFLVMIILATSYYFLSGIASNGYENGIINVLVGLTLFLQSAVLIPSIYSMHEKLNKPCSKIEVPHYNKCLNYCMLVFILSVISGGCFPVFIIFYVSEGLDTLSAILDSGAFVGEVAISCILAVNMLFISVDASVCCSLIDMLIKQQVEHLITIDSLNIIRNEVKNRVEQAYYKTNMIVFVALLDVLIVVILLLFLTANLDGDSSSGWYLAAMGTLFIKEIPFLLIVFLQCAKVNEKSNFLVKSLGISTWDIESDRTRMALYINAESDLISYPLANMRLTSSEVYFRFLVWSGTLVIGIVRTTLL